MITYFLSLANGPDDRFRCMFAEVNTVKLGQMLNASRGVLGSPFEAFVTMHEDLLIGWFKSCDEIAASLAESQLAGSRSHWVLTPNFSPSPLTKEGAYYHAETRLFRASAAFSVTLSGSTYTSEFLPYRAVGLKAVPKQTAKAE